MGKFDEVLSSIKEFDLKQIANEKVVVCLAVIGLAATVKTVWTPLTNYILDK